MNIKNVANLMSGPIAKAGRNIPGNHPDYGFSHLIEMRDKIMDGNVTGEKAHRWLGYMQGVVVSNGGASLEDMKVINSEGKQ